MERLFPAIDFKDRFPALDGLRALAITLVFLEHFGGGSHGATILRLINQIRLRGWIGVDLFFVLSGFLITGILYDTRHDSHYFKRFFLRRSLRIFPIFYLVVLLLLVLTPFLHYHLRAGHLLFLVYLGNFLGNYDFSYYNFLSPTHQSMTFNIGHFWSLCVEEQFYMLWPVVVWLVRDRVKLIRAAIGIAIAAALLRALFLHCAGPEIGERWIVRTLPFRMDSLVIGGILALVLRGPHADWWQRLCRPVFLVSGGLVLAMFIFADGYGSYWFPTFGFTLTALASAGLIGMALRAGSPAFRIFYQRPLRILGKYSYGFYVYHDIFGWAWIQVLIVLMKHLHSMALAGIVALGANFLVTFLVAKFSYDLFESKFLRLKKNFEYDSEQAEHRHAFTTR
jgi:peptidoglycan/LPS O-acetylase OafA/YrhL